MDILSAFRTRFQVEYSDEWIAETLRLVFKNTEPSTTDIAQLKVRFSKQWEEQLYEPTEDAIRVARWIYDLARGHSLDRYSDPIIYDARCVADPEQQMLLLGERPNYSQDEVPIYGIDGLPGVGKTALRKALKRMLPPDQLVSVEGDPPSRIRMISAIYAEASRHFGLVGWMQNLLVQFGADKKKASKLKSIDELAVELSRVLYRHGVVLLIVDELQWLAGIKGSAAAMNWLRELRKLGVPILFFANTDLMIKMDEAPAQLAQRIPRARETLAPMLRGEPTWQKIVEAHLALMPYGHTLNLANDAVLLYDMLAGSPRASGRLLEVALAITAPSRMPISMPSLKEAYVHPDFRTLRAHIALLTSLAPIDVKKRPELSSANSAGRQLREYKEGIKAKKLADAAAIVVRSEMTDVDRQADLASMTKILRENGEIGPNIVGIGESKITPKTKASPGPDLSKSVFAKRLAGHVSNNPTTPSSKPE